MKKIVITGGAGFIGSHIVEHFANTYPQSEIVVLDKMTYAADVRNILPLINNGRIRLLVNDICHLDSCLHAVQNADLVIHAAAESHVDNSFGNSMEFTRTNVLGTHALMEACRRENVKRVIHVSTDEVYGEIIEGAADEEALLRPTNPYSASKAAAEMIISGYLRSYKMPIVMVRANNIFEKRQFPEKIIPKFSLHLIKGEKLTIHGNGLNSRHYLSARDFAKALDLLAHKGEIGECYNVGTIEEYTNIQMAHLLCKIFDVDPEKTITFITDRPFNDQRYAVQWDKISALGWRSEHSLVEELPRITQWYYDNISRYEDDPSKIVNKPRNIDAATLAHTVSKAA